MASVFTRASGARGIQFVDTAGERKTIPLGRVSQRIAERVKLHVEALIAANRSGIAIDADTAAWLAKIDRKLRAKLVAVGLARHDESTADSVTALGPFLERYLSIRSDIKPRTRINYLQANASLLRFFGPEKRLDEITPGDADEFRLDLFQRFSENTARRHCGRAKQFFQAAFRKGWIARNPFADLKGLNVRENRERDYFVTREEAEKVLASCPNLEWRLIFALCRYAGLRCPSEVLSLTWADVDWERGRLHVRSPKTEHFAGKESRVIPIFPELRQYLETAFDAAPEGAVYVVSRSRDSSVNLRTGLCRIIHRAGLKPWPKLFHNLRATRETELASAFPLHVVCDWIGNSQPVAAKHYLRVTDADFEKALHNAQQYGAKPARISSQNDSDQNEKPLQMQGLAVSCGTVLNQEMPRVGLETSQYSPGKKQEALSRAAQGAALPENLDADLARVISSWPALPASTKAAILALVQTANLEASAG